MDVTNSPAVGMSQKMPIASRAMCAGALPRNRTNFGQNPSSMTAGCAL